MEAHCLRSYSLLLIQTTHRRGVHGIGGMAAQIPNKNDKAANDAAMTKVRCLTPSDLLPWFTLLCAANKCVFCCSCTAYVRVPALPAYVVRRTCSRRSSLYAEGEKEEAIWGHLEKFCPFPCAPVIKGR